jgi:DNA-directed RNA polymerase specialized sigma24 family protein
MSPVSVSRSRAIRRARRGRAYRDQIEELAQWARFLAPQDRVLVEQVAVHGQPASALAQLAGVSERQVQRRLQALVRRTKRPEFRLIALCPEVLPPEHLALARARFLEGRPLRDAADRANLSLHAARHRLAGLTHFLTLELRRTHTRATTTRRFSKDTEDAGR